MHHVENVRNHVRDIAPREGEKRKGEKRKRKEEKEKKGKERKGGKEVSQCAQLATAGAGRQLPARVSMKWHPLRAPRERVLHVQ